MSSLLLLFILISIAMILGVPIGISIGVGILAMISIDPVTNVNFIAQSLYSALDSIPLLAIPCFMLAGAIMQFGGLSKRLVNVANKLVGNFTGGLGMVTIAACLFFGAISGSAPATVVAIGMIMIPQMTESGYDRTYATALVAISGSLGIIIPPSIPMIIYGVSTYTSIGDLFLAGFIPGIIVALCLGTVNYIFSKRKGYKGTGERFNLKGFSVALWEAKWALLMPVIILGGIYGGIFTPTEASVIAVAYGLVVSQFIYKEINFKDIFELIDKNSSFVGAILLTFAPASTLGAIFSLTGFTKYITSMVIDANPNKFFLLLVINIFFLFIGMIMDTGSATVIFAPIVVLLLTPFGVHPVHIGIILIVNFAIAFVTPPVALNLFVASGITGISIDKIAKAVLPMILVLLVALMLVTYVPDISLGLLKILKVM